MLSVLSNMKFISKNKNGFTLVELLVVIAIIGILTIIVTASFASAQKKARDIKRKAELNALTKALQMYYDDNGKFPLATDKFTTFNKTINEMIGDTNMSTKDFSSNNYTYMKVVPFETKSGQPPFRYVVSASGKSYNLFAKLENTNDADCKLNINLGGYNYCFGLSSPNTTPGTTLP